MSAWPKNEQPKTRKELDTPEIKMESNRFQRTINNNFKNYFFWSTEAMEEPASTWAEALEETASTWTEALEDPASNQTDALEEPAKERRG